MNKFLIVSILASTLLFVSCSKDKENQSVDNTNEPLYNLFEYLSPDSTGFQFVNEIKDSFLMNILYYEYSYNGAGVAIGDVNNDGLPDVYMNSNMDPGKLFLNLGGMKFRDITLQAGVGGGIGIKTGVCMVDINSDGFLDIYITKSGNTKRPETRKNILLINNQDLTFREAADEFNIADMSYGTQSYFADIDLDGDLDLFIANHPVDWNKQDKLNLDLDDQGKYFIIQDTQRQYISDRLYINDNGKFIDKTVEYGVDNIAFALSAVIGDFNGDEYPDLFVCNDYVAADLLYLNQNGKGFRNEALEYFDNLSTTSMGSDIMDINNDGKYDLFTSDMMPESIQRIRINNSFVNYDAQLLSRSVKNHDQFRYNSLHVKTNDDKYSNISFLTNTSSTDWSWAVLANDYNCDGNEDLFITNGYLKDVVNMDYAKYISDSINKYVPKDKLFEVWNKITKSLPRRNYFYENNGELNFRDVRDIWNGGISSYSNGAAVSDLDNDGDLDIIVNNINQEAFFMENTLSEKVSDFGFINITLSQNNKNKFALGAKIKLTLNDGTSMYRYFNPIKGYMSSNDYRSHFGFAPDKEIAMIEVTWPEGAKEEFASITKNQFVTLVKGSGEVSENKSIVSNTLFTKGNLNLSHVENGFIDFKREPLLVMKNSAEGPEIAVADFNGDGLEDVYFGSSSNSVSSVNLQSPDGSLKSTTQVAFEADKKYEDAGVTAFDYDKDGDIDLIISSGGYELEAGSEYYQIRLYDNDGKGVFNRNTNRVPDIRINAYSISSFDYDQDGDIDLMVGGGPKINYYPEGEQSILLENDNGKFINKTNQVLPNNGILGLVKSIVPIEIEKGVFSIVLAGDWNPLKLLSYKDGKFIEQTDNVGFTNTNGWWQTLFVDDVDGDGDQDIIAGNLGRNSFFKASLDKPTCIYSNDFDHNGENDPVLCTYYGNESYPIYSRDELLNQMTTLRKKYLRYRDYQNEKLEDMFDAKDIKEADIYLAFMFESSVFYNNGGKFSREILPVDCQFSMVKSIGKIQYPTDASKNLFAVVGNFWDTDFDFGKYDASVGAIISFENNKITTHKNTGIIASGNVREIKNIRIDNKPCLIVGENNAAAYTYCPN